MSTTTNALNNNSSTFDVDNLNFEGNTIGSTDTNGNIILSPDGTGVVSITTAPIVPSGDRADSLGSPTNSWDNVYADGLTFDDGTNVLSNYVGVTSWTPALAFGGGTTGITYSSQLGSYTRIGNQVLIFLAIGLTSKGSSTGDTTITGFPLTFRTGISQASGVGQWSLFTFTSGYTQLILNCNGGTSTIRIYQAGNSAAFVSSDNTHFVNTTSLLANFSVLVD